MKKDIYVIANTLLKGGSEKQIVLFCKEFSLEYNINLILLSNQINPYYQNILNKLDIRIHFYSTNIFFLFFYLKKVVNEKTKNIFISYLFKGNFLNGMLSYFLNNNLHIGGFRTSKISGYKLIVQRIIHNFLLDYTITNSDSGYAFLIKENFKHSKVKTIYNTIDPVISEKRYTENKNIITILTVGRLEPVKNINLAINCINELILRNKKKIKIEYIIFGYGSLKNKLLKRIKELNLENNIKITQENDPDYFFRRSDIYFSTSKNEGISNAIMEAMSHRLPIVATDVGDNNKLVEDNFNGFLVEIDDTLKIVNCLNNLIENINTRKFLGENGYTLLKERFSKHIFKKKYNEIFNKC